MPETTPSEYIKAIKESPVVKEYRDAFHAAMAATRAYNGTERTYATALQTLIALEEKIIALSSKPSNLLSEHEQRAANKFFALYRSKGGGDIINALLDKAITSEHRNRAIRVSLIAQESTTRAEQEQPMFVRHITGVILPPGEGGIIPSLEGGVIEPVRFQERLSELADLFERNEVFLDDYIVTIGTIFPSQMRKASYAVVEVPLINRTILVCDQVGEATFVIHGMGNHRMFLSLTKEELMTELGPSARKIVRHSPEQWHSDLGALLFTEDAWHAEQSTPQEHSPAHRGPRIDVRTFSDARDAVLASEYDTPQTWINMTAKQASAFKLASLRDMGLMRISTILGVQGNPVGNRLLRLECARKIFGDVPVIMDAIELETSKVSVLESLTPEQIKQAILASEYNGPQEWVNMKSKQALTFKLASLGNIGLFRISTILGVQGNPISNRLPRLECARKIFGDVSVIMDAIELESSKVSVLESLTPEQIILAVLASERNTPQSWIDMTSKQANDFKLASLGNIGLKRISTVLGVHGNPFANRLPRLECARKIFGDVPVIMDAIKLESLTPEQIILAVLASKYNTPESWIEMTSKEALAFKLASLGNIGLVRISTILGVQGNPLSNRLPRLECARKIFGDVPVIMDAIKLETSKVSVLESLTPEQIIHAVLVSKYNTAESWINMTRKQVKAFKLASLGDIGLFRISTILGVQGNPLGNRLLRLECARKIFGDVPVIMDAIKLDASKASVLESLTPEQIIHAVLVSKYNTAESWIDMTNKQANDFKLASLGNIGLFRISTILGVQGNPISNRLPRLECARKIFGDVPVIMNEIEQHKR